MRRVALPVLLVISTACQFSEDRYVRRTITADELIGSWRATEFAIKSLRDIGVLDHLTASEHTLVLNADGSCSIQTIMNIPAPPFTNLSPPDGPDYRTYGTGCRWELGDLRHQALVFDLDPKPWPGPPYYYFAEEDGRLLLWQYATDPDAWRYMEFQKVGG